MDADRFIRAALANRHNRVILERWDRLALPDGWLVAGCLFQTVWNLRGEAAPEASIKDYDLFYFDGTDLSEAAERRVQARVEDVLADLLDLGIALEAKNQARVHLWYPEYFGHAYPQLHGARDGIARFLVLGTCVGIRPDGVGWEVAAPYGLALMDEGLLTPNPLIDHRALFEAKARSYQSRWPWLRIVS